MIFHQIQREIRTMLELQEWCSRMAEKTKHKIANDSSFADTTMYQNYILENEKKQGMLIALQDKYGILK